MSGNIGDFEKTYITGDLKSDLAFFKNLLKDDAVLRVKEIKVRQKTSFDCALLYIDGMASSELLNDGVIKPLLVSSPLFDSKNLADYITTQVLFANDSKAENDISKMLTSLFYGDAVLLIDKSPDAVIIDIKGWKTRGIDEPEDEKVLQGPREGFTEASLHNLAMIRRKLLTPDLKFEQTRIGRRSLTAVYICYLDSLADKNALSILKKRLSAIDIDGILDSNYIAELIRDGKNSLFKTIGTTERPDVVASKLLEGRIAVVVDGTPVVLTLPYLFSENFNVDEDYYLGFLGSSLRRLLRYFCFFLSIGTPAVFIALSTYHKQLLPTTLAITVAKLRGGVPFSPFSECILMLFIFEILKETGLRMPKNLGHALSIVGGLVVGQAAVEARIISTPMLIVIAVSGIAGLMIPKLSTPVFYLRLIFVCISSLFGLYGFITAFCITVMHIISLTSFEIDYTVSLRSASSQSLKDTFVRAPWNNMLKRPLFNRNSIRQKSIRKDDKTV